MKAEKSRLYRDVEYLTSIYPYRNYKNPASLDKAAEYIKKEMEVADLNTSVQMWEAAENTYRNVIGSYLPGQKRRFILGAHYDVYKEIPGADDNASSVAGLLEIARMLKENPTKLDYGIDFVAFSLEEPPFFKKKEMGSAVHAESIQSQAENILGIISMEMIGYYRDDENQEVKPNRLIVSGIKPFHDFNKKVSALLKNSGTMDSRHVSYAYDYANNGPSDHRNYWQYGIPAVMIIGTGGHGNPHYHRASDTIETLDFDIMKLAVENIAYAVTHIDA